MATEGVWSFQCDEARRPLWSTGFCRFGLRFTSMAYKRSHLSPRTRAYTKVGRWSFEVVIGADPDIQDVAPPSEHEYGWKPIWLKFMGTKVARPTWMNLCDLTSEELEAFKRLMDIAYEEAKVVVADLDRQACEVLLQDDVEEVPIRALASAPPWYDRKISSSYEPEMPQVSDDVSIPPPYDGEPWAPVEDAS